MNKNGIIIKGVAGAYTVLADGIPYVCNARGVFRNRKTSPLVGDYVTISVTDHEKKIGTLHTIGKRKNELIRPPVANIDQVIITVATAQPAFNAGLLDRFLVLAEYEDIPILICVNKIDLISYDDSFAPYIQAGYPLVYTSATAPPFEEGLTNLRAHMAGKTNVFAGPSGVGKSSLINALMPKLELETGELSKKLGRGRHTTRHVELFRLQNGAIIADTPGFSAFDTQGLSSAQELQQLFHDFSPFIGTCRFLDCAHIKEPGCSVLGALAEGKLQKSRWESYRRLYQQALEFKQWEHKKA